MNSDKYKCFNTSSFVRRHIVVHTGGTIVSEIRPLNNTFIQLWFAYREMVQHSLY